jgi:hypothetical protein
MFRILIDTCVWFDLAKDYRQRPLLGALEELIRHGEISMMVPHVVVDEVFRNKARIIEESNRSLSGSLKRAKEAVDKYGGPQGKRAALRLLNDVNHRLPTLGEAAAESIARVEEMFKAATIIETSDDVKLRAAQRAIDGRAPFHRQRNSIHDAILIETYADFACAKRAPGIRFAFITHNTKDFSHVGVNNKLPHPDISACFSRVKSLYFTTLGEALRRVQPQLLSDLMFEQEWIEQPRCFTEIIAAIDELFDMVWYNRHMVWREKIEAGKIKIVEKETFPIRDHRTRPIQRDVWNLALRAAAKKEKSTVRKILVRGMISSGVC